MTRLEVRVPRIQAILMWVMVVLFASLGLGVLAVNLTQSPSIVGRIGMVAAVARGQLEEVEAFVAQLPCE